MFVFVQFIFFSSADKNKPCDGAMKPALFLGPLDWLQTMPITAVAPKLVNCGVLATCQLVKSAHFSYYTCTALISFMTITTWHLKTHP
jgi:hypothetical protein